MDQQELGHKRNCARDCDTLRRFATLCDKSQGQIAECGSLLVGQSLHNLKQLVHYVGDVCG